MKGSFSWPLVEPLQWRHICHLYNTDTSLTQRLCFVPSVSVLDRFDCNCRVVVVIAVFFCAFMRYLVIFIFIYFSFFFYSIAVFGTLNASSQMVLFFTLFTARYQTIVACCMTPFVSVEFVIIASTRLENSKPNLWSPRPCCWTKRLVCYQLCWEMNRQKNNDEETLSYHPQGWLIFKSEKSQYDCWRSL